MPPEAALLLACLHGAGGAGRAATVLDNCTPDWERLVRLARRERATVALRSCLGAARWPHVPDQVRATLERLARVASFRMALLQQRLAAACSLLAAHGIPVMLLKGAALSRTVYANPLDRSMDDLDLLVPAGEAARAYAVVQGAGWRARGAQEKSEERYAHHHHLPPLDDASGTGVGLELHTELLPAGHPFAIAADDLWRRAHRPSPEMSSVLVPDPHHLLLHACVHLAWSNQLASGAWRTFRDIAALAAAGTVNWDGFVAEARAVRATTCCYWSLRLARSLAGVNVDDRVLRALRPLLPEALLGVLSAHFTLGLFPVPEGCPSVAVTRWLWRVGMRPRWSGHGHVVPWTFDQPFEATPPADAAAGMLAARVAAQTARSGAWRSYGRAVLRAAGALT